MTARPPEHLVFGLNGPEAVVTGRAAAVLLARTNLGEYSRNHRGDDPEVDSALVALKLAAAGWRERVADRGNSLASPPSAPAASTQWLSTSQAAERLGCRPRTVRWAITEGRLPAVWMGGCWWLNPEDVEHYRCRRAVA